MQQKNFIAPSVTEALLQIKEELGEDAIIISTEKSGDGFLVVAATDKKANLKPIINSISKVSPTKQVYDETRLKKALLRHGVLDNEQERILGIAKAISKEKSIFDDKLLLEKSFAKIFNFKNIFDTKNPFKMFMGIPGSGKSTAIAKVATKAKLKGIDSLIISTDSIRAGADSQLRAFADILDISFHSVKTGKELFEISHKLDTKNKLVLIDTPGINPFVDSEIDNLSVLCQSLKSELIMVMDSGRNTIEAVEIAQVFKTLGASTILPTSLDLTRRMGTVISAAMACRFDFCVASINSSIANGIKELDNKTLASLI